MHLYLTTGRILLLRPAPVSLFGMPSINHYLKLHVPGQSLEGHHCFPFIILLYASLFLIDNNSLYFGAFNRISRTSSQPVCFRWWGTFLLCSIRQSSHSFTLGGKMRSFFSLTRFWQGLLTTAPKFWQQDQLTSLIINLILFCEALKDLYIRFLTTLTVL